MGVPVDPPPGDGIDPVVNPGSDDVVLIRTAPLPAGSVIFVDFCRPGCDDRSMVKGWGEICAT